MKMIFSPVAIGLLLAIQSALAAQEQSASPLDGAWVVVAAERNGKADDDMVGDKLTFSGDKLKTQRNSGQADESTVTLDPQATPAAIDIKPAKRNQVVLGIYELKADRLQICFRPSAGMRPAEFTTKPDSQIVLLTLEREKK